MNRICKKCGITKSYTEFYKNKTFACGFMGVCKACHLLASKKYRESNPEKVRAMKKDWGQRNSEFKKLRARKAKLLHFYGMSLEQYAELLSKQKDCCAICRKQRVREYLDVDHCHSTGKVRGLLCRACNIAIGLFEENPSTLLSAVEYLKT